MPRRKKSQEPPLTFGQRFGCDEDDPYYISDKKRKLMLEYIEFVDREFPEELAANKEVPSLPIPEISNQASLLADAGNLKVYETTPLPAVDTDSEDDQKPSYAEKVQIRSENWRLKAEKFGDLILSSSTVSGKVCSVEGCQEAAFSLCLTCIGRPFCKGHDLDHNLQLRHCLRRVDQSYVGDELAVFERRRLPLMITRSGWFYDKRPFKEIENDSEWFPLTPAKPSVYVRIDLIEMAADLVKVSKNSVKSIVEWIEAGFVKAAPFNWSNNFGEAVRVFGELKIKSMNRNKSLTTTAN